MKVFSIDAVLEASGGAQALREALWRAGQPVPSCQRIWNWKWRKTVPSWWVGAIMWALAAKGVDPYSLLRDA